jgi:hypothetical protein
MKINTIKILLIIVGTVSAHSQGFFNLNFESANIPNGTQPGSLISISNALPGWTAYFFQPSQGIQPISQVAYDALSLGGATVSVNDTNTGAGFVPLQGKFSAFIFGGVFQQSATISQTALVPVTANSIQMQIGNNNGTYNVMGVFSVEFNGQTISMTPISNFPTYTLFAGDISAYANQVATLSITALAVPSGNPGPNPVLLDNIIFSPNSVPEPGTLALGAVGALLVGFRRWKNSLR